MKIIHLSLLLLFISCGAIVEEKKEYNVDPTFNKYIDAFYSNHNKSGKSLQRDNLVVRFSSSVTGSTWGTCSTGVTTTTKGLKTYEKRTPIVSINPVAWQKMTDENKFNIIDHELGHCLLNRGHFNERRENGVPVSIMHKYVLNSTVYHENYKVYQEELHSMNLGVANYSFNDVRETYAITKEEEIEHKVEHSHVNGELGHDECVHKNHSTIVTISENESEEQE